MFPSENLRFQFPPPPTIEIIKKKKVEEILRGWKSNYNLILKALIDIAECGTMLCAYFLRIYYNCSLCKVVKLISAIFVQLMIARIGFHTLWLKLVPY